jgi:MYXO-CTERM domain-containing protein
MRSRHALTCLASSFLALSFARPAAAGPVPSGDHPRLFMSAGDIAKYAANAAKNGTAAAAMIKACQDTIDEPSMYDVRGGSDGDYWPGSAVRCAFAYRATQKAEYLTQALKYWHASLDSDQSITTKDGCVVGVDTNWQAWDGNGPVPPVIITVTHDTGYPMRWYGPYIALTYDWLYGASGVDDTLRAQTRTCLTAWNDYYTARGYHADEAGANYNAGYALGKTLAAVAIGNDGGADGHLWTEVTTKLFPELLVGHGLKGLKGKLGTAAGPIVGGDWGEGWQYGPLSVLEYALGASALEANGEPQPEMSAWTDSLVVRYVHGTVPDRSGQWVGGDFDDTAVYAPPNVNELDAVLAGPSSDAAAGFAAFAKQQQFSGSAGTFVYNAIAETRDATPVDYTAQKPAPALWYLARGTRAVYARTSWDKDALWSVFTSAPAIVSDHIHYSASNFVLNRGADALVVDPSEYGEVDSLATNATTVDSSVAGDGYVPTQTPWSEAELLWARGTDDSVYAARTDFAKAFIFSDTPSDIKYAHREWVMFPEGEVVAIDRAETIDASHGMYVRFHTNTGGHLTLDGAVAKGDVGGSSVAIHEVFVSGGTPAVTQPKMNDCLDSCSFPCAKCDEPRFTVDELSVKVPGPWAVAVHVVDALAKGDAPSASVPLDDDSIDPGKKDNGGVLGAAVRRGDKQSYVVASNKMLGVSPTTMTYGVPGSGASRHVVFDAPEDQDGRSIVKTSAKDGRCEVSIEKGAGFAGHPLMFLVASAADGCKVAESTDVPPSSGTGGGNGSSSNGSGGSNSNGTGGAGGGGGGSDAKDSGCGCRIDEAPPVGFGAFGAAIALVLAARRRRRNRR